MASLISFSSRPGVGPGHDRSRGERRPAPPTDRSVGATSKLRQPALAPPVMFAFAERLSSAFGDAEIELLHVLVLAQRLGIAIEHHAAVLQHITVARVF